MGSPFRGVSYINLARRPDRRRLAEAELAELAACGFPAATRIEAVDGLDLQPADWVARGAITADALEQHSRPAMACACSHFLAWSAVAAADIGDDDWWLVVEDDFVVHPAARTRPEIWRAYWDALPPYAGLVMVGATGYYDGELLDSGERLGPFVVRLRRNLYGTFAYALTRRFARAHLSGYFPLPQGIDSFAARLAPVYALCSIDDARWGSTTPPDFYRVERAADHDRPVVCSGLVSVRADASDIQYGREGLVIAITRMIEHNSRREHEAVRALAARAKPLLMKQLFPDLYLKYLDVCIAAFWYVDRDAGLALVRELRDEGRSNPAAQALLADERVRFNLSFYGEG